MHEKATCDLLTIGMYYRVLYFQNSIRDAKVQCEEQQMEKPVRSFF